MKTLYIGETGLKQLRNGETFYAWDVTKSRRIDSIAVDVPEAAIQGISSFGNYIVDPANETIYIKERYINGYRTY